MRQRFIAKTMDKEAKRNGCENIFPKATLIDFVLVVD